jgi:8-oxo-dGTP pyrophosphatase MutT (NUDIX family)
MKELHYLQMQILRELLYNPRSRFGELNISRVSSDHFNYHLKVLTQQKLIAAEKGRYVLTTKGKEFANTMDTDKLQIEKQPKAGVMVIARSDGRLLIQKRLKEPYYGFLGFITGKIRFGETIHQTAARELREECGLSGSFKLKYILHEHVYNRQGDLLEDKIFFVVSAGQIKGSLISTREGENIWMKESEYLKMKDKYYDEEDILSWFKKPPKSFIEKTYIIDQF